MPIVEECDGFYILKFSSRTPCSNPKSKITNSPLFLTPQLSGLRSCAEILHPTSSLSIACRFFP